MLRNPALALVFGLAWTLTPVPAQDLLYLKGSRKPLLGTIVKQDDKKVVFNPYRSTHAAMTHGLVEYPAKKVKAVKDGTPAHERFWVEYRKNLGSADGLCKLAAFCKDHRLRIQRSFALEQVLRLAPDHPLALKEYGKAKAGKFLGLDPVANKILGTQIRALLLLDDADARAEQTGKLIKACGLKLRDTWFARVYRSSKQPKGTHHKRPNRLRRDEFQFEYTLHVPDGYDPHVPSPLLLVLHGGGPGGPTGVIGSGQDALTLYAPELPDRDYIVVCPTAKAAPWSAPVNDGVVTTLLEEIELLYNIDETRVYLTGHSMGGYGTWHFGPKYCERWAAIGPTCGGGHNGLKRLRDSNTFVFLFHGGDDPRVSPGDSRAAAKRMLEDDNDFVYTELPDSGHSLPNSVVREMFDFFDRKRLAMGRRLAVRPRSSFLQPEGKAERQYFGRLIPR